MTKEHEALVDALGVLACELGDRLEETSSNLAQELVELGQSSANIIVRLQGFDRMRQELTSIGNALRSCGYPGDSVATNAIVAEIPLSDVRRRLKEMLGAEVAVAALEVAF